MEIKSPAPKKPIINCHTHVFTGDHVPPYLAKTLIPWPFYYLLSLSLVIKLFRLWYRGPYTWQFKPWYRNITETFYRLKMTVRRNGLWRALSFLVGLLLVFQVFLILAAWLSPVSTPEPSMAQHLSNFRVWLNAYGLLFIPASFAGKVTLVLVFLIFYKSGRNLVWFLLRKIWSFLGVLPGPESKQLAKRYLKIGRFSFYKHQARIFGRLRNQYPPGTAFVVLPMDMEYMEAGPLPQEHCYQQQMKVLARIKQKKQYYHTFLPFVFADPRRMLAEGAGHFNYRLDQGEIVLGDCFIKQYIEGYQFSGFKIYPALGYYPFDEALLPLWKYAADHSLPVLTHCIKGTIYYRGEKKREWDYHPIFEQACGDGKYKPLALLETKNRDFANNFTHPLNYLCLLEEELLRKLVAKASSDSIRELFGYVDAATPMARDLSHLKLCFGHFGGDDEWEKFFESDRENSTSQLIKKPDWGLDFLTRADGKPSRGKLEQIWRTVDWYTIICSLMLQYPHVYSDISYILHNPKIQPLLRQTLSNNKLREKVLFGTDFYVVRNHKSEKSLLADMSCILPEHDFDQIARHNPDVFLRKY